MPTAKTSGPGYLPTGYELSLQGGGADSGGLGLDPNQIVFLYRRGGTAGTRDDWLHPLAVFFGPVGAPDLISTEEHANSQVDVGVPGVATVYYDGLWGLGPGQDQVQAGDVVLHWDSSEIHSVTMRWAAGTAAVRGAKARGVGYDELIKIAASVFAPGSGGA